MADSPADGATESSTTSTGTSSDLFTGLQGLVPEIDLSRVIATVGVIAIGLVAASVASKLVRRLSARKLSPLQITLITRTVFLFVLLVTASMALGLWGRSVTVLFGAAGILTLAIGFASQTSASNLIAGIFLMAERSLTLGDVIQVNGLAGEVVSIDLLSVKLRKFDNVVVRIPNEVLIKADVETFSRYPIRRVDLRMNFHPHQDLDFVRSVLEKAVEQEPRALVEPKPDFVVDSIVDGNASARFSVWATQVNFVPVRNKIAQLALAALAKEGVALVGPRRVLELDSEDHAAIQARADTSAQVS